MWVWSRQVMKVALRLSIRKPRPGTDKLMASPLHTPSLYCLLLPHPATALLLGTEKKGSHYFVSQNLSHWSYSLKVLAGCVLRMDRELNEEKWDAADRKYKLKLKIIPLIFFFKLVFLFLFKCWTVNMVVSDHPPAVHTANLAAVHNFNFYRMFVCRF